MMMHFLHRFCEFLAFEFRSATEDD
ncbi:hypothetical protein EE36_00680 [Sulfitobacter sp. EE-36]|nr:hypothetical protein EE36_00680 [Sulfitobacter sp. EE-36]